MLQLTIRNLTPDDVEKYRELRLRGLQEYPQAFGSSYEEESILTPEAVADRLASSVTPPNFVAGAFQADGKLVGMIGFFRVQRLKLGHKGMIWGMYVTPELHSTGAGSKLMQHAIEQAKTQPGLTQIQLAVVTSNESAKRLYQRFGFVTYGLEKDALVTGGTSYDEDLMALYF